jgi:DNA-binding response OmpR family regulator
MDEHMSSTESPDAPVGALAGAPPDGQRSLPEEKPDEKPMKVVVYSHDAGTRAAIRLAIGRRPTPDVAPAEIIECATEPALFRLLDAGTVDVMVLDGEAQPAGGMGVCRQAKDEIYKCPPVLLIIGRPDDGWLATWSRADSVVSHPIEPTALAAALGGLMRQRAALTGA